MDAVDIERRRIDAAEAEARRFLGRMAELRAAMGRAPNQRHPRQMGALKRASMDLSRSLSDLRRSVWTE